MLIALIVNAPICIFFQRTEEITSVLERVLSVCQKAPPNTCIRVIFSLPIFFVRDKRVFGMDTIALFKRNQKMWLQLTYVLVTISLAHV